MQVYSFGAQDGSFVGEQDGGDGFEEVEGLFRALVVEFFDVVGVVAAYADYLFKSVSCANTNYNLYNRVCWVGVGFERKTYFAAVLPYCC